ncbi:hypothetical protein [Kitasatospora mediocidica]|uniref:hypothetical protein n=1 Tax=Kitasatospora mediocidica TaxID=58352 RepID=UPI0005695A49|nr:hypothetical protein [Kitasatospora mediocidica]
MDYGTWATTVLEAVESATDEFPATRSWGDLAELLEAGPFQPDSLDEHGFFELIRDWDLDYLDPVTVDRLRWYLDAHSLQLGVPSPWDAPAVENYAGTWFLWLDGAWQEAPPGDDEALAVNAPNAYLVAHGGEQDARISIGDDTSVWLYSGSGELLSQLVGASLINHPADRPVAVLDASSGPFANIQLGPLTDGELAAYVQVAQESGVDGAGPWTAADGLPIQFVQQATALCRDDAYGTANARCSPERHRCGGILQIYANRQIRLITCREPLKLTVDSRMRLTRPEEDDESIEALNAYVADLLSRAGTKPHEVVAEIEALPPTSQALLHGYTGLTAFLAVHYVTGASESVAAGTMSVDGFLTYFAQLTGAERDACLDDEKLSAFLGSVGQGSGTPARAFFADFVRFGEEGRYTAWGRLGEEDRVLARNYRAVADWETRTLPVIEELKRLVGVIGGEYGPQNTEPFFEAMALGRRLQKSEVYEPDTAILGYLIGSGLVFAERSMIDSFLENPEAAGIWESLTPLAQEGLGFQERVKSWRNGLRTTGR